MVAMAFADWTEATVMVAMEAEAEAEVGTEVVAMALVVMDGSEYPRLVKMLYLSKCGLA